MTGSTKHLLLVAVVLLTVPLAGCAQQGGDDGGGDGARFSSFDEAMDAPGRTLTPADSSSPYRIKLIEPPQKTVDDDGEQEVVLLVYDSETNEPVEDADFSAEADCTSDSGADNDAFCAWMPAMGHGTSPEESPTHDAHGVYVGMTTWSMSGTWQLALNPEIGGSVVNFDAEICVQSCS